MNEDKFAKILTAIIVGIMVLVAIFSGSGSNGGKRKLIQKKQMPNGHMRQNRR